MIQIETLRKTGQLHRMKLFSARTVLVLMASPAASKRKKEFPDNKESSLLRSRQWHPGNSMFYNMYGFAFATVRYQTSNQKK